MNKVLYNKAKEYADTNTKGSKLELKCLAEMLYEFADSQIADIKANCDYVLEGKENEYREERSKLIDDFENMKAGLESQIATLGERCNQLLKDKGDLTDRCRELEQALEGYKENATWCDKCKRITEAKEHIQTLISCLIDWVQEGDKDYCYIAEAEQFLKEIEK